MQVSPLSGVAFVRRQRSHHGRGTGPNDVWVVGAESKAYHWNGEHWSWHQLANLGLGLRSVFASSPNDVWTVGSIGFMAHWDGSAWSVVDAETLSHLEVVWGTPGGALWAAGRNGTILRRR